MQAAADLEPETSGGRSALKAYEKSVKNAMQANERDKLLDLVSALQHYDIATAAAAEFLEQNPDGEAQLQPELSWVRQQSSELQAKLAVHAAITIQRRCVPWRTEAFLVRALLRILPQFDPPRSLRTRGSRVFRSCFARAGTVTGSRVSVCATLTLSTWLR